MGRKYNWIQTYTGLQFSLTDPQPDDVNIKDIARALSNICRFTGHVRQFYSVAQHSVLASEHVPLEDQLAALLHDAHEAYIGDMSRPLKKVGDHAVFKSCEQRIEAAIKEQFGIKNMKPQSVADVDLKLLVTEARDLFIGGLHSEWTINAKTNPPFDFEIIPWHPDEAMQRFLFRYHQITGRMI